MPIKRTSAAGNAALLALRSMIAPMVAVAIALIVGGALVIALGDNPVEVYGTIVQGSLVGWPNFLVTLQTMTPLLFTGLAVAVAFRAGLWNIGAEGQLIMGALCSGIVGYAVELPRFIHLPLCLIAAMLGGAIWGLIPAVLRVKFRVNELVVCLMMNPIALLLSGWIAARVLKAPGPTNKLPDVLDSAGLTNFSVYSQVNAGFVIGLFLCILFAFINLRTKIGFQWRMIGLNPRFANYGGMQVERKALSVFLISAAIAGLGGAEQVLGQYHAFYDNFSPGYGFDGIAVAMLAGNNPIGVILAALLFGALNSGGVVLQMMTGLSKYLVQVLQFIIVLILSARFSWEWLKAQRVSVVEPQPQAEALPKNAETQEN
ncbi:MULTISPECIES: ABC transporter permease [Mesorhizobium]|uniref:Simple sugar transport system permease protein n=1 Tax=Mesorhizobium qingshengii TaxID=1165689 RepID=A0A1G5ZWD8_9HYPH|nr:MULTISPECIES: ABC transporter permease [Mesorhizobium]AID34978.1 ABC transporter permease [Mesorhizobium huakuii 7653R]MCH4560639.1 ABC transporter permease [Mesorhizobium jarvisii]SDA99098.1 simple sugar transport system permease protein [Mesorhizobium qingshengii]